MTVVAAASTLIEEAVRRIVGTGAPYSATGKFRLAGSTFGTTGGGAMIVGGGSLVEPVSSIRVVPSFVQKLSHSSSKV